MPELPEVEIVKRSLKNRVKYKKIKKIIITNRNLRFKVQKDFENLLEGRLITSISRFSKYIIISLDNHNYCLIHLGMSGTLHLIDHKKKEKNIKNFLLDQKFVSGIGNIYASEILFISKINPFKKAKNLTKDECKKILLYSKVVLKKAIKKGGSSIRDFQNIDGKMGNFQKDFNVYQRENLKCIKDKCKGVIKKKVISNRSSFFCNYCQK